MKEEIIMRNKRIFNLGLMLMIFIFMNLLVTTTLYILKINITNWNFIISLFLTIVCYLILVIKDKYNKVEKIVYLLLFICLIFGCIFVSGKIYDNSYDGNSYHKIAIAELSRGWNPVYQSIDEFNEKDSVQLDNTASLWNDHYGKASWIYAANIYNITGNIECGKSITLLIIIATFLISASFFKFKNKLLNYLLAFLIALNPVITCQISTFYVDGILGNCLIILLISLSLMAFCKRQENKIKNYILYFVTLSILINIKFTGFAFAGIYSLLYYVYYFINKSTRKDIIKPLTITAIISLAIGIGIIGLSTYPKNLKEHGHPFYPLYGEGATDIMTANTPPGFLEMNRLKRFIVSNFSNTSNAINSSTINYHFKIPFMYKNFELDLYSVPDVRISGYGVLFGGAIILSVIGIGYYLLKNKLHHKNKLFLLFLPLVGTAILIIILEDSWWARYLPQLYLLPVLVIMMLSFLKGNFAKYLSKLIILILVINSYLIINRSYEAVDYNRKVINNEIYTVKSKVTADDIVYISSSEFTGALFNVLDKIPNSKIVKDIYNSENISYVMDGKVCVKIECKGKGE